MKYEIIYESRSGNTRDLATAIHSALPQNECVYCGTIDKARIADNLFIGFWTDNGNCTKTMKDYLNSLHNKHIVLFGTAGFGKDVVYFEKILETVKNHISDDNKIIGSHMCQGKMPIELKAKYESALKQNSKDEITKKLYKNYLQASTHPNGDDLGYVRSFAVDMYQKLKKV